MNYYVEKLGNRLASFLKPILAHFGAMQLKDITPVVVSLCVQDNLGHLEPSSKKRAFYTPMNAVMKAGNKAGRCPLIVFEAPKVEKRTVEYANDVWMQNLPGQRARADRAHHAVHDVDGRAFPRRAILRSTTWTCSGVRQSAQEERQQPKSRPAATSTSTRYSSGSTTMAWSEAMACSATRAAGASTRRSSGSATRRTSRRG